MKKKKNKPADVAWKTRKFGKCVICKSKPRTSKTAKTCSPSCATLLAWKGRK